MANHKSAEKRNRQSIKRRDNNRVARSAARTSVKETRIAIEAKDSTKAKDLLKIAIKTLAKNASKGRAHKRNIARRTSRLALAVNKIAAGK